jgi:hypothetical protein
LEKPPAVGWGKSIGFMMDSGRIGSVWWARVIGECRLCIYAILAVGCTSDGLDLPLVFTQPRPHTSLSVMEECLSLCIWLFGDRMPLSNANSFVGWQSSTDFGYQACRRILMSVSPVPRSRTMWSIF